MFVLDQAPRRPRRAKPCTETYASFVTTPREALRIEENFLAFLAVQRNKLLRRLTEQRQVESEVRDLEAAFEVGTVVSAREKVRQKKQLRKKKCELESFASMLSLQQFDKIASGFLDIYYQRSQSSSSPSDADLIRMYKAEIDPHANDPNIVAMDMDFCTSCGAQCVYSPDEAMVECAGCGVMNQYVDASSSTIAYGDEVEYTTFSYKRINHLNEWLNHFQAKNAVVINQEVYAKVMAALRDRGFHDVSKIGFKDVRKAVRDLGMSEYYSQIMQIWCRITNRKPIRLDPICEELFRLMFTKAVPIFDRVCPSDRKNFLSYGFLLHRFAEIQGYTELLDFFSLLKGQSKLNRQEEIFEQICKEAGWRFIPLPREEDVTDDKEMQPVEEVSE